MPREFVGLAAANEGCGNRRLEPLRAVADDFGSGGGGQFGQFVEGIAHLPGRARLQFCSYEKNPFGSLIRCRDERFQLSTADGDTIARIGRDESPSLTSFRPGNRVRREGFGANVPALPGPLLPEREGRQRHRAPSKAARTEVNTPIKLVR